MKKPLLTCIGVTNPPAGCAMYRFRTRCGGVYSRMRGFLSGQEEDAVEEFEREQRKTARLEAEKNTVVPTCFESVAGGERLSFQRDPIGTDV